MFGQIFTDASIRPILDVPAGVEVILREGEEKTFLCILNHLPDSVTVDLKYQRGTDLLTGKDVQAQESIESLGVRVIAIEKTDGTHV